MSEGLVTKTDLRSAVKDLEELLLQFSDSLGKEIQTGLDRIDGSVKRHSGMIVSGTVAISTVTKTITRLEGQMRVRDKELRDLRHRIERLERRKKSA